MERLSTCCTTGLFSARACIRLRMSECSGTIALSTICWVTGACKNPDQKCVQYFVEPFPMEPKNSEDIGVCGIPM